jgi:hypothetical protein
MITHKIRAMGTFIVFASTIPVGPTLAVAADAQNPQCALSVSSSPFKAEIYLNKLPGKRTTPDAYTPTLFKNFKSTKVSLTLFKKGYSDTTLLVALAPAATTAIDISMIPLHVQALPAQDKFLRQRFYTHIGKYCLISTPAFIAAGAGLLYYAGKSKKRADDARSYLDKTIVLSGSDFDAMQQQYTNETRKRKTRFGAGIAALGAAAVDLGAGIFLYF